MRELILGIVDFREQHLPMLAERFCTLAAGQSPDTLFTACADSRVVPNLLLSSDPGDLFTMRNIGTWSCRRRPTESDRRPVGGQRHRVRGVELKVRNIVVCGHSGCAR